MSNLFDNAAKKLRNSSFVLQVMVISVLMFGCSLVLMYEDWYSSYNGFKQLEAVFGVNPANSELAYMVISIVPQIGQIGFFYLYAMDTRRKWALGVAAMFFFIDLTADVQDRSSGQFIAMTPEGINIVTAPATWVSVFISIGWYTVGSELFFTAGGGLILAAFPDAVKALTDLRIRLFKASQDAQKQLAGIKQAGQQQKRDTRQSRQRQAQPRRQRTTVQHDPLTDTWRGS